MTDLSLGRRLAPVQLTRAVKPQVTVMGGQLAAGVGNLLFAVAMVHVLPTGEYADVVAFLALFVLLHVPGVALSAAGALAPDRLARLTPRVAAIGAAVGIALVAGALPIGRLTGLPIALVGLLGVAAPAAGLVSLQRGLAYGREQHQRVMASLIADAGTRVVVGVPLALALGATGAAAGTVVAGYAGLLVCTAPLPFLARGVPAAATAPPAAPRRVVTRAGALTVGMSFVAIAVLQSADLLVANRVLASDQAAAFGVLSTIGGAAFFATATIPLVLMPSVVKGRQHAATAAVALTAGVGLAVAAGGALLAPLYLPRAFGEEYADLGHLVGPYLLAMALLGVVRVQLAGRSGRTGSERLWSLVAIGAAIATEVAVIAGWARSVDAVVATTLLSSAGLAIVIELPYLVRRADATAVAARRSMQALWAMVGLCVVATGVRMATSRGLWVDEAISVVQAQQPFGRMIAEMKTTDVHPPLHHAILWVTVRIFGTSEVAVRLPSLVAGVALVPVLFWVGRTLFDRRTGWIAAMLATIAPFCVWYSQEARMYSQFMLFAALAIGFQVLAVRRGRWYDWALYGVSTALLFWTQYFGIMPILVQQAAFGWAVWHARRDPVRWRRLARGWALSSLLVVVLVLPIVSVLQGQLAAYGNRGAGLAPSQAGAGSSAIGGTISVYSVGANLIWAFLGYHADGPMVQIAALWPLLMLLAFVMLGRGRSGPSLLLLGLVVVPMGTLFAIGSLRSDLFELRYFSGAVPAMLLLAARVVTATTARKAAVTVAACVLTAVMLVGLVDQQLNGANPRLYDFKGAFGHIEASAEPGDIVLFEPDYLSEVVGYYGPGLMLHVVGTPVPPGSRVWVVATERVLNEKNTAARLGTELARLEESRTIADRVTYPNVTVWELVPS
ncbi:MAG TPA: glycosyltransferase family 39 protein [Ilumatobacteraceae bacterium]|nr:glycosyltransferase family 39 protein [Ilumatobacteraceae bacterium]